jgi:hypothetical protein
MHMRLMIDVQSNPTEAFTMSFNGNRILARLK